MKNTAIWYRHFGVPEQTLKLETAPMGLLTPDLMRVRMLLSPVNASDLIPVTGAYGHRVKPPLVAGYEGVGQVISAPESWSHLVGKRVLPLCGQGTWQSFVDCPSEFAIPVPDWIDSDLAARAYINPVAAMMMLRLYAPEGKHVLLTAAGSDCGLLLGQWALRLGALSVTGIHRSAAHASRLAACGITSVSLEDVVAISRFASGSDLVFDATGGELATSILQQLPESSTFISYGLLSGNPFKQQHPRPVVRWFHIRNYLNSWNSQQWHSLFSEIWSLLNTSMYSDSVRYPLYSWKEAICFYRESGRTGKPLLVMN
ncbi:alcohol dehydrogenase [Obesumbacterium proteus]|uniref:zinc-dependent alcohol dehydrogenase family protein n=1 Tax=Obesumbacterium proteus TaxID=82983 RepID=UPI0006220CFC|nr:zinc-dependent alcohol dehydrogenase family protein [Obesumbacterium proteus]KKI44197.1 alcohol dehydrogenase [Obesumbacterium proteus]